NVSGVRLSQDDDHKSLLCEGIPLVKEELVNESLRSMEMLRHLPMAVCQFDMEGKVMFQNPEAVLWKHSSNNNSNNNNPPGGGDQESKEDDMTDTIDGSATEIDDDNRSTTSTTTSSSGSTANAAAKKMAGNLLNRFVDPNIGKQLLQQIQTSTEQCDMEAMLNTKKGPRWSAIQVRKVKDPVTGESVILYNARDKTDAVNARKEKRAREQKSEFLAIMAHEIRTPLHQVTGFIDLLDQTSLNTEQKSFVKLLQSSAQGLMTVISDVLDYSKLEAGKMKLECIPHEVRSVVEGSMEAVRQSCEEKDLYLKLEWNKDIPFKLMGDPNRLRQILLNLLSNAAKFTKKGGISVKAMTVEEEVTISSKGSKENQTNNNSNKSDKVPIRRHKSKPRFRPMVKFVVEDTGMGISQEHRDVIFRKYQQADVSVARNFGGTGLGLSICQLLTQNMGGSIGVDSTVGKGSQFWFTLPAVVPTEKDPVESSESDITEELGNQLQVLVVEDNKVNQKLMVTMLKRMGHACALAENGKEAIDMIEKTEYHLVLMDIQMPVMDGLEATRRLRSMGYNNLPIYGLTASVARSDFREFGFNDWLPKPIPMKALKAKLHHFKQNHFQQATHTGPQ
ncbi:Peroxide stress-activated histidine kinase mak2 (Partial), partial [Seminavis robusta]